MVVGALGRSSPSEGVRGHRQRHPRCHVSGHHSPSRQDCVHVEKTTTATMSLWNI